MERAERRVFNVYIPPFWCGVGTTLLVELVALIVYSIVRSRKDK